eukprot:CAMPEP_0180384830 /NCGR_PEP_ID=MMETSP0989-20121125/28764_1 /TAXON_ID=697907 /ORGANISM="non described non described, Strain CCMP2293" /LENGTH=99 /DNA_ID=CAMNT_0022385351 /DNA_START=403 /DNA_END=703 /DNA_ORIENTATION=+
MRLSGTDAEEVVERRPRLFRDVFGLDHGHGGPVGSHANLEKEETPDVHVPVSDAERWEGEACGGSEEEDGEYASGGRASIFAATDPSIMQHMKHPNTCP